MVGFLKFLKREKRSDADELDLPPEPPPLEGFEDKQDFPEFPEMKAYDFDMSKFDVADAGSTYSSSYEPKMPDMKDNDMPDFPEFPEMEEGQKLPAEPEMQFQPLAPSPAVQQMPAEAKEMPESEPQHMQRRRLFHHEKRQWEKPAGKEIYVRIDKFKAILDGISMIKSSVRESDGALMRLESIKNSKDRAFDRIKSSLEDLQKKLIFIDKTLFKGD